MQLSPPYMQSFPSVALVLSTNEFLVITDLLIMNDLCNELPIPKAHSGWVEVEGIVQTWSTEKFDHGPGKEIPCFAKRKNTAFHLQVWVEG